MKPTTESKKRPFEDIDLGVLVVRGAAFFQAYQFGRALAIYDHDGWNFYGVNMGGLLLGGIVNLIIVLAASKVPGLTAAALTFKGKVDKKTQERNERKAQKAGVQAKFAQAAFFGLLILSPSLVAPALYIAWSALPLPAGLIIFLSLAWAVAPDLAIALGGFVAGKSLGALKSDAPAKSSVAGSVAQRPSATLKSRSAKNSASLNDAPAKLYRCECGKTFTFEERFKYSGHTRICIVRKAIKEQMIPVDISSQKAERKS